MELLTKDFEFELKALDDSGIFEGYAAVTGNVDSYRDIILPGAFAETIKSNSGRVPLLWQHERNRPIGICSELAEDAKGLKIKAKIVVDSRDGKDAYALLKDRAISGLSIGYSLPPGSATYDEKRNVRKLAKINLHEISCVTFSANPQAQVTRVKQDEVDEQQEVLRAIEQMRQRMSRQRV